MRDKKPDNLCILVQAKAVKSKLMTALLSEMFNKLME